MPPSNANGTAEAFIRANMRLMPVPAVPEIRLYAPHANSGLGRFVAENPGEAGNNAPYWAYAWAGGTVLARYILDNPQIVAGKCALDVGAGGGIVGIAAAMAGAAEVRAAEIDSNARAALALNAQANDVAIAAITGTVSEETLGSVDIVLAGDVYYAADVGEAMTALFARCTAAGLPVLVGDPGRADLATAHLRKLADARVPDVGSGADATRPAAVYTFV